MPYKTGSWGEQAKERSKRRLEYFREYRRKNPQLKLGAGIPIELIIKVIQRANNMCEQHCGKEGQLIHHIDENRSNNVIDNLQFLCRSCHISWHKTGERHPGWQGDKASDNAKYMREFRKRKRTGGEL